MMTEDNWLTAAMSDTGLAAELLLKLRAATLPLPSKRRRPPPPLQSWTVHQRRSRTQAVHLPSNKSESPNASPSTPLSLSGGTSVSGGAGGVDSTHSNHNRADVSRSKVTPPHGSTSKRPRKKKNLAALRVEEGVLMKEQDHLKRKLAALQANYEKQIKEIVRLRKIKLDIRVESQGERPMALRTDHFEVVDERNDKIVLPDLNVPLGEDAILSY